MPHMLSMPQSGFQALILCGPGIGLSTFTSIPDEYPKALVSVANRPMVWYALDWCYRMGVTGKQGLPISDMFIKLVGLLLHIFCRVFPVPFFSKSPLWALGTCPVFANNVLGRAGILVMLSRPVLHMCTIPSCPADRIF
jgi:hypothetical protein